MNLSRQPRIATALLGVIGLALLLSSCPNVFLGNLLRSGQFDGSSKYGSVQLSAKGPVAAVAPARTLRPAASDLQASTYTYALVGPGGKTVNGSDTTGTKSFTGLVAGGWSVTIEEKNASNVVLLTGSTNFTIAAGQSSSVSVAMTASPGTGQVDVTLNLPSFITGVTGTTQDQVNSGPPVSIDSKITGSSGQWSYQDSLAAGTYLLTMDLKNAQGNVVAMIIEDMDVFAGISTNPQISLRSSDLNQPPAAPAAPSVVSLGSGQVGLRLSTVLGATGYNVYYAAGSTATTADTKVAGSPFTTTSVTVTGLTNATQYAFVETAINGAGEGTASTPVTASPALPKTVTYDGNGYDGGSVPTDSTAYEAGQSVTTLGNTGNLSKSGYAFAGWTTNPSTTGTTASYAAGATWVIGSADVTLYAVWIPSNLTFSSTGGAITMTGYSTAPTGALAVPPGVTSIGQKAFYASSALTSVSMPSSVTSIQSEAFFGAGLTAVSIGVGVATIGEEAFARTALTSVTIPAGVTSIAGAVFGASSSLSSISVDPANPSYSSASGVLFDKSGATLIEAPSTMTSYAIPSGVTSIGDNAFAQLRSLASVTIPSTVTSIGQGAFTLCPSLTSITLPSSLVSIGYLAFGSTGLTSVTIPSSVTSIGIDAFAGSSHMTAISVDPANPSYSSLSGVVFDKSGQTLIEAPGGMTSYDVPSGVTTIGQYAFEETSLANVTIPSTVTSIGMSAFYMTQLTSVTIPASVTSIGNGAFANCGNLTGVTMQSSTPPTLSASSGAFSNVASGFQIHVPDSAAVSAYQTATGWSDYASEIVTP